MATSSISLQSTTNLLFPLLQPSSTFPYTPTSPTIPISSTSFPSRRSRVSVVAASQSTAALDPKASEKLKVVVKKLEKPRVVLKFIWMEKNIGLGLDQMVPGHGCVPLSPYYFWPRKDAWEELKTKLEEKQWISQKRMIILLNQATDVINLWQQAGGNL